LQMKSSGFYEEKAELYRLIQNDFLLDTLLRNFRLNAKSIHGISHWLRVLKNCLYIAKFSTADIETVKLFAIFHDCMRKNEEYDPSHGAEGAAAARILRDRKIYNLADDQLSKLYYACKYHTDGQVTSDPTVGTCWDADRLDLPRVGIEPGLRWLSTTTARTAVEASDYALWKKI
jgi:uncharacterized protein